MSKIFGNTQNKLSVEMFRSGKVKKLLLSLSFVLLILITSTVISGKAYALWLNPDWSHRQMITIDESMIPDNGDLIDFPVFIRFTLADSNPVFANARSDGYDILFAQADGVTLLSHEIEEYDSSTEDLNMWVKIPVLDDDGPTDIYMYYGNPGASSDPSTAGTWNSGFVGVWHLKEDPFGAAPQMQDSTSTNNGTANNMESGDQITGQVDGGLVFDGVDEDVNMGDVLDVGTNDFTFSAWINTAAATSGRLVSKDAGSVGYKVWMIGGNGQIWLQFNDGVNGGFSNGTIVVNDGNWHHVVGVFDRDAIGEIYIDGVYDTGSDDISTAAGSLSNGADFAIGSWHGTGNFFDGSIDEVRISNIVRSPDWIETSFNNQDNPSSFLSFEPQEEFVPVPAMTQWGMIAFVVIAGLGAVYLISREALDCVI